MSDAAIESYTLEQILSRVVFIESDCARAMELQDFDKLDRLQVVKSMDLNIPPAVASACS